MAPHRSWAPPRLRDYAGCCSGSAVRAWPMRPAALVSCSPLMTPSTSVWPLPAWPSSHRRPSPMATPMWVSCCTRHAVLPAIHSTTTALARRTGQHGAAGAGAQRAHGLQRAALGRLLDAGLARLRPRSYRSGALHPALAAARRGAIWVRRRPPTRHWCRRCWIQVRNQRRSPGLRSKHHDD